MLPRGYEFVKEGIKNEIELSNIQWIIKDTDIEYKIIPISADTINNQEISTSSIIDPPPNNTNAESKSTEASSIVENQPNKNLKQLSTHFIPPLSTQGLLMLIMLLNSVAPSSPEVLLRIGVQCSNNATMDRSQGTCFDCLQKNEILSNSPIVCEESTGHPTKRKISDDKNISSDTKRSKQNLSDILTVRIKDFVGSVIRRENLLLLLYFRLL
jgi:hypothetical protein